MGKGIVDGILWEYTEKIIHASPRFSNTDRSSCILLLRWLYDSAGSPGKLVLGNDICRYWRHVLHIGHDHAVYAVVRTALLSTAICTDGVVGGFVTLTNSLVISSN